MDVGTILSGISIVIALVSLLVSWKSSLLQNRVSLLEEQLKKIELQEKWQQIEELSSSKVEAKHVALSGKKHVVRISNTGNTRVTNVRYTCDEECASLLGHDHEPVEFLDPGDSYNEYLLMISGIPCNIKVITHWTDRDGLERSRENLLTL